MTRQQLKGFLTGVWRMKPDGCQGAKFLAARIRK
jgi:hypothetical protein